ncbi:ATP-dependent 3' to 5' DNA helicase [Schizosaccharomyces japonicus yFS275]|uniref:ATP-dependent DNA helicase n=1 Tax=Schizosaccharomyces japonicus (strain yFS275 / FY16936) TaxID=402676 RepID=B6K0X2_SCHJY|nr:ATP-dependent 3' to 5' DNA helicase [Schizosaccharomyces japonicus yFS275]EEB07593.1 ATP-dependent 3' to 5' DNA helicase [Schizosaccharomyces japonicus yFS275]
MTQLSSPNTIANVDSVRLDDINFLPALQLYENEELDDNDDDHNEESSFSDNDWEAVVLGNTDQLDEQILLNDTCRSTKENTPTKPQKQLTLDGSIDKRQTYVAKRIEVKEGQITHYLDRSLAAHWIYPTCVPLRQYQYNFSASALFNNVLLALPTGLGKTFIAAVVMMNYYRWFPQSNIAFLAPTKPLLYQQMQACIHLTGIPESSIVELNGEVKPELRKQLFRDKRVFFVTPQTLNNDIQTEVCDPRLFVCLVFDEAHRATGLHPYAQVLRSVLRYNTSFRVLALTATPGSNATQIQKVVDALHISKIIIRNDDSLDIRPYIHTKCVRTVSFTLNDLMQRVQTTFAGLYKPFFQFLKACKALPKSMTDYVHLRSFPVYRACRSYAMSSTRANASHRKKVLSAFHALITCTHLVYLLECHGLSQFYEKLVEIQKQAREKGFGELYQLSCNTQYQLLIEYLQEEISKDGYISHPKIEKLKELLEKHFTKASQEKQNTRVMIFTEFRSTAEIIMESLATFDDCVRPSLFVGQASRSESFGMSQKLQKEILQRYRSGLINTLIATSIGEEGLDIQDTDMIICYDVSSSPIRMLQRIGRTGRKRNGLAYIFLTQNCEDNKWQRAKDSYRRVQKQLESGKKVQLKTDVPRILPADIVPECLFVDNTEQRVQAQLEHSEHVFSQTRALSSSPNSSSCQSANSQTKAAPKRYLPSIVDDVFEDLKSNLRRPTDDISLRRYKMDYRDANYGLNNKKLNLKLHDFESPTKGTIIKHSIITEAIFRTTSFRKDNLSNQLNRYKLYTEKFERKRRKLKKTDNF